MNAKVETQQTGSADMFKWILVAGFLVAGIVGNAYFNETALIIRVVGVLVSIAVALGIAATTRKGADAISFSREARLEVRKVVWPTKQETIHTTLYVLLLTALVAVLLWMMDFVLIRLIGFVTGQGA